MFQKIYLSNDVYHQNALYSIWEIKQLAGNYLELFIVLAVFLYL